MASPVDDDKSKEPKMKLIAQIKKHIRAIGKDIIEFNQLITKYFHVNLLDESIAYLKDDYDKS